MFYVFIWVLPIAFVIGLVYRRREQNDDRGTAEQLASLGGGLFAILALATALIITVRLPYPQSWFDISRELYPRESGTFGGH
jgi:hypothetical protein